MYPGTKDKRPAAKWEEKEATIKMAGKPRKTRQNSKENQGKENPGKTLVNPEKLGPPRKTLEVN